jgi:L-asparaginase / beta-aspartyl-peptidase
MLVAVHGGVSGVAKDRVPVLEVALPTRPDATALDLVEAAVRALEDHPELNAGYGSVLNQAGELELDAGVADGATGRCAGVANVRTRHPITTARRVMDETPHVLLTGAGAIAFSASEEQLDDTTPAQRARWEEAEAAGKLGLSSYGNPEFVDTVGAVALDDAGHLAAGSSTGGVFGKLPGRVGDAPIFGAGMYADERVAVVGTGVGEIFLEGLACSRVAGYVALGISPQEACERVVAELVARTPPEIADPSAGLLAVDAEGRVGAAFKGGSWPVARTGGELVPVRTA